MGLGRSIAAFLELCRLHRPAQRLSVRRSGLGGQHVGDVRHQRRDAWQHDRSQSGLLRSVVSGVQRFCRQRDLPVWEEQLAASSVFHPGPSDHADPRLRRLSIPAVHLGRHDGRQMCALSGRRPRRSGQHVAAELRVRFAHSALSGSAHDLRVRLAGRRAQESVSGL